MIGETSKKYLEKLLGQAASELGFDLSNVKLDISVPDQRFGDYATNVALILGKQLKRNPAEIAAIIADEVKKFDKNRALSNAKAAGGFINFSFSNKYLAEQASQLSQSINIEQIGKGKKVVFEYSSPNTNKPLHIGHTRNDMYGAACINLLKAIGYQVVSCEIINDRGIHIMKSLLMYQRHGKGQTPEQAGMKPDHFVGKFYEMFAQEAGKSKDKEKQLMEEAQELLRKWEAGDKELKDLWQKMNNWFFAGVKETYQKEGSFFDEVDFESQIYDKGREIILDGVAKGIFTKETDGSVSVDLTAESLDKKILLRKDGTTLYITQDIYLWHSRNQRHHPDVAIVTTSSEQTYHFKVLKKVFELLKYPWAQNFKHLPYEHVFLGQSKMSSREGNSITADDLLDMIKEKVREVMSGLEKIKEKASNEELVEKVAFAAIKYGYLKYEPNTRIYFDPEQTIALEGNTGPYLQYAYARIQSILKKSGKFKYQPPLELTDATERALMRQLIYYAEKIILAAALEYKPNLLANYLYELASKFNAFYSAVPVLNAENESIKHQRLALLMAVANVLKHGLNILGIEAPEEM